MREIFANIMTKNDVTRNDNKITLFYKPTNIVQGPYDIGYGKSKYKNLQKKINSISTSHYYIITM